MLYDYLIVGQGLAGSALAIHLLKRRKKFILFDQPSENVSSNIAAGIYNPITGKNWVKTWKADEIFPYMASYYKEVQNMTGKTFLFDRIIYRPFSSIREQNEWMGKSQDPLFRSFIKHVYTNPIDPGFVINPFGGLEIASGGYLEIFNYLEGVRNLLIEIGRYRQEHFDFDSVTILDDKYKYGSMEFRKVVFCQGPQAVNSKLWNFLPFRIVKGEIMTVEVEKNFSSIYNKGAFILPLGEGICRVGSTYDRKNLDSSPSKSGREQLVNKLKGFFKPNYRILDQTAGIRPATVDRKPFLGMHPNEKNLSIFNGLGAKGVTLAPFFADHLLNFLENDQYLMKEVEINRFIR